MTRRERETLQRRVCNAADFAMEILQSEVQRREYKHSGPPQELVDAINILTKVKRDPAPNIKSLDRNLI